MYEIKKCLVLLCKTDICFQGNIHTPALLVHIDACLWLGWRAKLHVNSVCNVVELISVVGIFFKIHVSTYGIFNRLLRASLGFGICHKVNWVRKKKVLQHFLLKWARMLYGSSCFRVSVSTNLCVDTVHLPRATLNIDVWGAVRLCYVCWRKVLNILVSNNAFWHSVLEKIVRAGCATCIKVMMNIFFCVSENTGFNIMQR